MSQENKVFAIFDDKSPEKVRIFTTNHMLAMSYQARRHEVIGAEASVVASVLHQNPSQDVQMSDKTWALLLEGMETLDRNRLRYSDNEIGDAPVPFFESTPMDLPLPIAQMRLKRLEQFPSATNLLHERELIEICMAHKNQRPVNAEMFTQKSRETPTWKHQIETTELGDFQETGYHLTGEYQSLKKTNEFRANENLEPDHGDLMEEARILQDLIELDHMIEDQHEHLGLVDDDDDLQSAPGM